MLENDLTNIEMLIMKCIWDTPEELALSQLVTMVNERFDKTGDRRQFLPIWHTW